MLFQIYMHRTITGHPQTAELPKFLVQSLTRQHKLFYRFQYVHSKHYTQNSATFQLAEIWELGPPL